jgi:SAM-dependent methyltransferase
MKDFREVPVEEVKAYWDRRPCNVRHSKAPVDSLEYSEQVRTRRYFVEPHTFEFAEFDEWRRKNVLEIGCGIGTDAIEFARHGAYVAAVELSEESLKIARLRAEANGYNLRRDGYREIRFFQGNAEELSRFLPRGCYDLIYSLGVIHHTPHPERVLLEARWYLKSPRPIPDSLQGCLEYLKLSRLGLETFQGGELRLLVYNRYSWKTFWVVFGRYGKGRFWKWKELVARYSEAQEGSPITYTYTKKELRKLLESCGYRVKSMYVRHIFPYSIPEYLRGEYKKVWYFRWMPERLFHWLEQRIGWHLCAIAERDD